MTLRRLDESDAETSATDGSRTKIAEKIVALREKRSATRGMFWKQAARNWPH